MMRRGELAGLRRMFRQRPGCCLLAVLCFLGGFAVKSSADFSDRRQIIVFAAPDSESGKLVQRSAETLRCQLTDRDTDVRFVDITELPEGPDAGTVRGNDEGEAQGTLTELARLRSAEHPDFEVVLIGKDGGVKARTSDSSALEDFLGLIDTMPMRRAEVRSKGGVDGGCD